MVIKLTDKQKSNLEKRLDEIKQLSQIIEEREMAVRGMLEMLSDELPEQIQGLRIEGDKLIIE